MNTQTRERTEIPVWTLGDRMGKALDHAGIGMQEMADYLGVSRNSVSNWVHGRVSPSRQTLLLWSYRTGVDLVWITAGDVNSGVPGARQTGWFDRHGANLRALMARRHARRHARERSPLLASQDHHASLRLVHSEQPGSPTTSGLSVPRPRAAPDGGARAGGFQPAA